MSGYYEMTVTDKRWGKGLKRILLLISLFILLTALIIFAFAMFTTYWLLLPFAILCAVSAIISNIGHLLTRDYMYCVTDSDFIVKRLYAERYFKALTLPLSAIREVVHGIAPNAVRYTPFKIGITLIANSKSYAVSPDDYMLALIMKGKGLKE